MMERDPYLDWLKQRLMDLDHQIICATQQRSAFMDAKAKYEDHLDALKKKAATACGAGDAGGALARASIEARGLDAGKFVPPGRGGIIP